jgi:hypothetical protein
MEEKAKVIAEREAAQNARAQQRLAELVRLPAESRERVLINGRLASTQHYQSQSPLSDLLVVDILDVLSLTDYSILSSARIEIDHTR